ncbi:MAG: hypothetical protein RL154_134 [Pseudomonadota bacterium]|jgi:ABC-type transporter Mla MlaB component
MIKLDNDCLIIAPTGDFTIYTVEQAHKEVLAHLNSITKIKLELQDCTKIDSASFQFLIALYKETKQREYVWEVNRACENIIEFISFYNMNEILK